MNVTTEMLKSRLSWIRDLTGLTLALDFSAGNVTLYLADPLKPTAYQKDLAFHETKGEMFQTLRCLYDVCAELKSIGIIQPRLTPPDPKTYAVGEDNK